MNHRDAYPSGAPCWIDTLQPDPETAAGFYGALLGWRFDAPVPTTPVPGDYRIARIGGRAVAGLGQAPPGAPAALWTTYVRVTRIEDALRRVTGAGGAVLAGPLGRGEAGRIAVVADPAGVAFGLCEAGGHASAELVDTPGAWAMSALHTPDPEEARAFYGALFGWVLEPVPGAPLALWRLPGHVGGVPGQTLPRDVVAAASLLPARGPVPPHWAVNLRVESADRIAERALDLGGSVLMAPADAPGFRSAVIGDPQGGVVAVSVPRPAD